MKKFKVFAFLALIGCYSLFSCNKENMDESGFIPDSNNTDTIMNDCGFEPEILLIDSCSYIFLTARSTVPGNINDYTYLWSNGTTGPDNRLTESNEVDDDLHWVVITDSNGCQSIDTIRVNATLMDLSLVPGTIGSDTLYLQTSGGNPPFEIEWAANPDGMILSEGDDFIVTNGEGYYFVVFHDTVRGCSGSTLYSY